MPLLRSGPFPRPCYCTAIEAQGVLPPGSSCVLHKFQHDHCHHSLPTSYYLYSRWMTVVSVKNLTRGVSMPLENHHPTSITIGRPPNCTFLRICYPALRITTTNHSGNAFLSLAFLRSVEQEIHILWPRMARPPSLLNVILDFDLHTGV